MSEILFKRQMLAGLESLTLTQNICPQTDCVSFIISFYAVGCVSFHAGTSLSSVHGKYQYTSLDTLITIYPLTIYNTCLICMSINNLDYLSLKYVAVKMLSVTEFCVRFFSHFLGEREGALSNVLQKV